MFSRPNFKRDAKLSLQGRWGYSVGAAAIAMYISPVMQFAAANLIILFRRHASSAFISIVFPIAAFVIAAGLSLGLHTLFLAVSRNRDAGIETLFSGFSNLGRAIILFLLEGIFIGLWSLLFVIPGIVAMYRYRLAFFILSESPEIPPLDALRISKEMTRGRKGDLFLFDLSYIGWTLLTALTCSLVGLYVIPYYLTSLANCYKEIKKEYIDRQQSYKNADYQA